MGKRIAFVGAGAVGGYVGGYLAHLGHDATLIDPWPEHIETIRRDGLQLYGLTPQERLTVTAAKTMHLTELHDIAKQRPIDIAFVSVKSYDTEWATMLIRPYLAPDGYVVSLQNCINEERSLVISAAPWQRAARSTPSSASARCMAASPSAPRSWQRWSPTSTASR